MPIVLSCRTCGKDFSVDASRAAARLYCTRGCWRSGIKAAMRPCPACGTPFVSKVAASGRSQEHCSHECRATAMKRPAAERMWDYIDKSGGPDACWPWSLSVSTGGYGQLLDGGRTGTMVTVHRLAYSECVGPIADGLQIDHLCRNRRCCNPKHLEPVTHRENMRRGIKGDLTTHCPLGHPLSGANLVMWRRPDGHGRRCLICVRARELDRLLGRRRRCKRGHEFTTANTRVDSRRSRQCLTCAALRAARRAAKDQ